VIEMLDKKFSRCLVMNDFLLFSDGCVLVEGVTPIDSASMEGASCPREAVAA